MTVSAAAAGVRRNFVLAVPLLAAAAFVQMFAGALPLTDEWNYTHAIRRLHDVDPYSLSGIAEAIRLYPTRHFEHIVALPFVLYWPAVEWTHFDSRWVIYITVAAFAAQALLFRRSIVRSPWWALPIALLLFCPSHYMEFLWGWQITVALSVLFPLAGLVILDGLGATDRWPSQVGRLAAGIGCILLGVFSSAGGYCGFVAAILLVALKRPDWRAKLAAIGAFGAVAMLVYWHFTRSLDALTFGRRELMYVCTALGATLWGSPVGLFEFGLDWRSAAGLAIVACTAAVVGRALVIHELPRLALALSITLFGYLSVVPIAMVRGYLGNWHVQYALPAVCGAYAAAYVLWTVDKSAFAAVPFFGLAALLTSCLFGYYLGFTEYGPDFLHYTQSIEEHVLRNLEEPGLPTPYPAQGENDLDAPLALFLSAHGHPLFASLAPPGRRAPLPPGARVFVDATEMTQPLHLAGGKGRVALLTVVVPGPPAARGVLAKIGDSTLTLRRVHMQHTPEACRLPGTTSYMGVLVPHLLPRGDHPVELTSFE
jgi:hypothetical protein